MRLMPSRFLIGELMSGYVPGPCEGHWDNVAGFLNCGVHVFGPGFFPASTTLSGIPKLSVQASDWRSPAARNCIGTVYNATDSTCLMRFLGIRGKH